MNPWVATQLVLATLKLCKVIDWSWWLVLTPFWICLIGYLAYGLTLSWITYENKRRYKNMTPQQRLAVDCRKILDKLKRP